MSRQNLALTGVGVLVLLAFGLMAWAATRTVPPSAPPPSPTMPAAPTIQPDARPDTAAPTSSGVIATDLFSLTLPAGWQFTTQPWPTMQSAGATVAAPLIAAWPGASNFAESPVRLTIAALPRHDLALAQYLRDVEEQFNNTPGIGDVAGSIVTDLRRDGLPVAVLTYTTSMPTGAFAGQQAATFDAAGAHLLLLTLVQPADADDGASLLHTLMDALHLIDAVDANAPSG